MTFLPAQVTGHWFFLYLILDLYSRKIVGWEVHDADHADHAAHLVRRTTLAAKPVLHGDNGAMLKATTVLAMLHWLGIRPSYSRLRVSDDNAYAEALFRTARYRPEFPAKGFADLGQARTWAADFGNNEAAPTRCGCGNTYSKNSPENCLMDGGHFSCPSTKLRIPHQTKFCYSVRIFTRLSRNGLSLAQSAG